MARRRSRSQRNTLRLPWRFVVWTQVLALAFGGLWFMVQPASRRAEVSRLVQNAFDRDKHVSLLNVAWDIYQLYYSQEDAISIEGGLRATEFSVGGYPRPTTFAHGTVRTLSNRGYAVGYSEILQNPVWAAYRVRDVERLSAPPRPERFEVDRRTVAKVDPEDYSRSGYDRGHLAPNFAIATRYGRAAQRETFLMSNIVPQRNALNAGLWRELETRIATNYAARYGEVWVVCGPLFGRQFRKIDRRIAIPDAFFLIVIDEVESHLRTLAYILPQEIDPEARLSDFAVSIDAIEERSGFDVLAGLNDAAEQEIERKTTVKAW